MALKRQWRWRRSLNISLNASGVIVAGMVLVGRWCGCCDACAVVIVIGDIYDVDFLFMLLLFLSMLLLSLLLLLLLLLLL